MRVGSPVNGSCMGRSWHEATFGAALPECNRKLPELANRLFPWRLGRLGNGSRDDQLVHPAPVHLGHVEPPAPPLEMVALGGDPPELRHRESPRRPVLGLGLA